MDSTTLLLVVGPMILGLVFNAMKIMRFIGFLTGANKRTASNGRSVESFDERLAERLRELERTR